MTNLNQLNIKCECDSLKAYNDKYDLDCVESTLICDYCKQAHKEQPTVKATNLERGTVHDYIDITESNQHHVNQQPLLTDWEIDNSYYTDFAKYELLIDTCNLCGQQTCWVHDDRYPVQSSK